MTRRGAAVLFPFLAVLCSWSCEKDPTAHEGELLTPFTPSSEVSISPSYVVLHLGEEIQFALTANPATRNPGTTGAGIEWLSSNQEVATVTEEGVVTAIGPGKARIRAMGPDFMAAASVRVR